jgi:hypothetical protein
MKSHNLPTPRLRAENIFPFPQAPLPDFARNISAFGERMWKLQQESVRFMGERFEDNMKTLQRLTACKTLPDLLAAQQKWFADTAQAYGKEWGRCADMMTEAPDNGSGEGHEKDLQRSH